MSITQGLDVQLDEELLILQATFLCGACGHRMEHISQEIVKCPSCGEAYNEH
ncbi:MAG TPA: hypothetical protein VJB08_05760 [Candidatus Nanoarchaeia archaeon]|nr:hypothetical protein [Candidatus Nanoarchaeia archaeon]